MFRALIFFPPERPFSRRYHNNWLYWVSGRRSRLKSIYGLKFNVLGNPSETSLWWKISQKDLKKLKLNLNLNLISENSRLKPKLTTTKFTTKNLFCDQKINSLPVLTKRSPCLFKNDIFVSWWPCSCFGLAQIRVLQQRRCEESVNSVPENKQDWKLHVFNYKGSTA